MFDYTLVFLLVFSSQILLISYFLPKKLLGLQRHVVDTYPPAEYPRLYPISLDEVRRTSRLYWRANLLVLFVGLAAVVLGVLYPSQDLLFWDNDVARMLFLLLQVSPLAIVHTTGLNYLSLMRRSDSRTTRKAVLRPRRMADVVSPAAIGLVISVYLAFVLFIIYVDQFDFPWFGGYSNIVVITIANLFFAGIVAWNVYRKNPDPYQATEDRLRQNERLAKIMVISSVATTLTAASSITLACFELRHLDPLPASLLAQLLVLLSLRALRIDNLDFEVYRADPVVESRTPSTSLPLR